MGKKSDGKQLETILTTLGLAIAGFTLLFGDNIYFQITGRSFAEDLRRFFPPPTSSFYYFFNSDEDFSQDLWQKFENAGCGVQQKDGRAVFSATATNSSSILCLISAGKVQFEKAGSMEAKLSAASGATGDYSIGIIEFSQGTFDEGTTNWILQCGILQIPSENRVELFFNVHSTYPQGEPELYKTISASTEHWYTMRLEIVPDTDEIVCYSDDKVLGAYKGSKIAALHQGELDRKLLGFWSPQSQATFYADDVQLLSPK